MRKVNVMLSIVVLFATVLSGCGNANNGNSAVAIIRVNLVPMTAEVILPDQTVLIEGDRIIAIGNSDEIRIPRGAKVIDGGDAYLMPGLADMHVHIYEESIDELPVSPFNLYIAKGVTTIRDCGTAPIQASDTFVLDWRDAILTGEMAGPMIYSSGRTIHGPVANPAGRVRQRYSNDFDFVKLYMELSILEFTKAQETAEELGMYSVGHIPYQVGFEMALDLGLDEIAHVEELSFELMWFDNRPSNFLGDEWLFTIATSALTNFGLANSENIVFDPEVFRQVQGERLDLLISDLLFHDISVGTTFATYEAVGLKLSDQDAFLAREETVYLYSELVDEILSGQNKHQLMLQMLDELGYAELWFWKGDLDILLLQELHKAGVRLVSGTDAGSTNIGVVEGYATHDDLRFLTEHDFTPYEALLTATVNAAYTVGKMNENRDFGTIEVGNRADLILVSGNPLENISNAENILGVMARGRWYAAEELEAMIAIDN